MAASGIGKKRRFLLAVAAVAVGAFSCDDSPTVPNLTYPTTYAPLPAEKLALLTARFERENPGSCTTLDAYGFTKGISSACNYTGTVTCSNADQLIEESKADVVRNQRFTGVLRPDELRLWRYSCEEPGHYSQSIHIRFENQIYDDLEVLGTRMLVHMGDDGVWSIVGHHYPMINVPISAVSVDSAKASLVGLVIHGFSYGGGYDYTVTDDSFVGEPFRVIFPCTIENRIELHVAWNIQVSHWIAYVDTMTGERIAVEDQLIY